MNNKYLHYNSIELAQDAAFVAWVEHQAKGEDWQEWLAAHPEKKATVEEARRLVQAIRVRETAPSAQKINVLWDKIDAATAEQHTIQKSSGRRIVLRQLGYVAAAASVALLVFFLIFKAEETVHLVAERGEVQEFILPDGSVVLLNAASELTYQPEDFASNRIVFLEGEGFFEVTKGDNFTVETDKGLVRVLGTSFNVNARAEMFAVACFTGRVEVQVETNTSTILTPFQKASWNAAAKNWETSTFDSTKTASWRDGLFYFSQAPLEEIFTELERQFNVTIEAPDSILQRAYTGFFDRKNLDSALYNITWPMDLTSEKQGNSILVQPKE